MSQLSSIPNVTRNAQSQRKKMILLMVIENVHLVAAL